MKKIVLLMISVILVFVAGCSSKPSTKEEEKHLHVGESHYVASGDLQEATASIDVLPKFLDGKDDTMRQIYLTAAANSELLEWIPCYCGCGESAGHIHNGHCFFKEIRDDGVIVWDDHATRCYNCMEIAVYSAALKQEGMTTLEIRNWVDENYKEGYAKPTPTPMPEG